LLRTRPPLPPAPSTWLKRRPPLLLLLLPLPFLLSLSHLSRSRLTHHSPLLPHSLFTHMRSVAAQIAARTDSSASFFMMSRAWCTNLLFLASGRGGSSSQPLPAIVRDLFGRHVPLARGLHVIALVGAVVVTAVRAASAFEGVISPRVGQVVVVSLRVGQVVVDALQGSILLRQRKP